MRLSLLAYAGYLATANTLTLFYPLVSAQGVRYKYILLTKVEGEIAHSLKEVLSESKQTGVRILREKPEPDRKNGETKVAFEHSQCCRRDCTEGNTGVE